MVKTCNFKKIGKELDKFTAGHSDKQDTASSIIDLCKPAPRKPLSEEKKAKLKTALAKVHKWVKSCAGPKEVRKKGVYKQCQKLYKENKTKDAEKIGESIR